MASVVANNKVGFLVGPQSAIATMMTSGGATPGYFYLTSEEHRLYVGNSDGSISAVNEGVKVVSNLSQIPTYQAGDSRWAGLQGQFYYVSGVNILCVCSGEHWVQINPDTYLKATSNAISTEGKNTSNATIQTGSAKEVTFTVRVEDDNTYSTSNDGSTTESKGNSHVATGNFTLKAGDNVTLDYNQASRTVTFSVPDSGIYDLGTSTTNVNGVDMPQIVLNQYTDGTKTTIANSTAITIQNDDHCNVVPTLDNNGNIVLTGGGLADGSVTITQNAQGQLVFKVDDGINEKSASIKPQIQITGINGTETKEFTLDGSKNLVANLGVYSAEKVDQLIEQNLQGFEAMHFEGTLNSTDGDIGSFAELRDYSTSSGAVFKVTEADTFTIASLPSGMEISGFNSSNSPMEIGDMIIVTGTETNGVITSGKTFTYIPSGDDTDIYWTPSVTTNGQITWAKSEGNKIEKVVITEQANSQATVGFAQSSESGGNTHIQTITIGHKVMYNSDPTPVRTDLSMDPTAANWTNEYEAISGLTLENGHVTGIQTKKLALRTGGVSSVVSSVAAPTNYAGTGSAIQLTSRYTNFDDTNATANNWILSSDTLTVSARTAGAAGTPADIHVDMVWGSFGA